MAQMDSDSYEQTTRPTGGKVAGVQHGAGANPSTAAGLTVLLALGVLLVMRRSFRNYA